MIKYIWLILPLLLCCRQQEVTTLDGFAYVLTKSLMVADQVESLEMQDLIITRPPRATVKLINFSNGLGNCFILNYQIPSLSKKEKGVLSLEKGCDESLVIAKISNVEKLSYKLSKTLVIKFLISEQEHTLAVPLINISRPKKLQALSSSSRDYYYDGLVINLSPLSETETKIQADESFPDHKARICHDISDECEVNSKNNCSQCTNGWYSVIGKYACEEGLRKYCGKDQCGQKGWPACQRFQLPEDPKQIVCVDNSPYGFCQDGLAVYCVNNELVCL